MIRIRSFICVVCLMMFVFAAGGFSLSPAFAGASGQVFVGDKAVMTFYDDGASDPADRANTVQTRINHLLKQGSNPRDLKIVAEGNSFSIYWGSEFITQADAVQAKLNHTTPKALAAKWVNILKKVAPMASFYLVPSKIELVPGSFADVQAAGVAAGDIRVESIQGSFEVNVNQGRNSIHVRSTGEGSGKVVFGRGTSHATLIVKVKEPAAYIPAKIEMQISGDPATADVMKKAAINAVQSQVRLKSGATMIINADDVRVNSTLERGQSVFAYVPVIIKGNGFATLKSELPVILKNTSKGFSDITTLMVSDRPESVFQDGVLFASTIYYQHPIRLLYYHYNRSNKNRVVWVELKNPTNQPVTLRVSATYAGPDRYGVTVGHLAAYRFLKNHRDNLSWDFHIPPAGAVVVDESMITPYFILAGYIHMEIVEGKKLDVYVANSTDERRSISLLPVLHQPFDPFMIHPKGVFKPANIDEEIIYEIDQPEEAFCFVGKSPWLIDATSGEPNNGNYGVFYQFKVKLVNNSNSPRRVGFFLVPESRLARGTFIFNGKLLETDIVRNPERRLFAIEELRAGENKEVEIITTPEGGSYYPVRISVCAVSNDAVVPPMNMQQDSTLKEIEKEVEKEEEEEGGE